MRARFLVITLFAAVTGCGSSTDCAEDEVEVSYLRGDRDGETVCEPRPATCGDPASCSDTACIRDMYGLCEAGYIGVGCSDTFAPPIISCNPVQR